MYSHFCPSAPPDKPGRTCTNSRSLSVMTTHCTSLLSPAIRRQSHTPVLLRTICRGLCKDLKGEEVVKGPGQMGGQHQSQAWKRRHMAQGAEGRSVCWLPVWNRLVPLTAHFTLHRQLRVLGVTLWTKVSPQRQLRTAASVQVPARHSSSPT